MREWNGLRRGAVGVIVGLVLMGGVGPGLSGEAGARERWGPFRGQVVDVETGQPIAGAVMLVVWWELHGIGFIGERFYEAREAVTDAEGRFEVPRLGPPWALSVQPPRFHLFAPGYERERDIVTPPDGERFVVPTVVSMRPLKTKEERRRHIGGRLPAGVPDEKMPEFIRAIDKERSSLGLGTYR